MKNKKAGIITFHNADNLGAVLQAYALQTVLKNVCKVECEIIDYNCGAIQQGRYVKKSTSFKQLVKNIPLSFYYKIKRSGFDKFRKKYLNLSKSYDKNSVNECNSDYDLFITGSDQVWNLECSGDDYSYFLDFVDSVDKKYSYAASIGAFDFDESNCKRVFECLRNFNKISVRESSAVKKLEQLGIENIAVHPDPVLLLDKEQWLKITPPAFLKEKYVFVYLIQEDVNVLNVATKYAQEHNCKIINNKKSLEFIIKNSPESFLSWIYNSQCVFTNSFHATAFSLIFNKPLGADIELANGGVNNRVRELVNECCADNCIISNDNAFSTSYNCEKELHRLKAMGLDYLITVTGVELN